MYVAMLYVYVSACSYVRLYVCMSVCVCMYIYMSVHMYVCSYTFECMVDGVLSEIFMVFKYFSIMYMHVVCVCKEILSF